MTAERADSLPSGWVLQGYRYASDPTPAQEAMLRSNCGAQRYAFNWGLGVVTANLDQRTAERSYGMPEGQMTPLISWSAYSLRKQWNRVKDDVAPWWPENSKECYSSRLANLAAALGNWSKSRTGERRGPRIRFPRFASKKAPLSCRFTTGVFGLAPGNDRRHVKLPRIGVARTWESTRKLARRLRASTARIRSATVTFVRGRWFVSFSVEVRHTTRVPRRPAAVVGVDLGLTHLAVLSQPVPGVTDEQGMVANPKRLGHAQAELRRIQRQAARRRGPDRRSGQLPSRRWRRTRARVVRVHARVANARADGLHQLTSVLTDRFGTIVVKDLHVAGMLRNRRLARGIADAGWGELRRQLEYKTRWRGCTLAVADRWYPSSKTCSNPGCRAVKNKLRLSDRVFRCDCCGFTADRDINAARNLATLASRAVTGGLSSPSCGVTLNEPDGNPVRPGLLAVGTATGTPVRVNVA